MNKQTETAGERDADIELLRDVVSSFIRYKDALLIEREAGQPEIITMQSHADDYGRIVGVEGRNLEAVRTIFRFIAARRKEKLVIFFGEPHTGKCQSFGLPYQPNPKWKSDKVVALIEKILGLVLVQPFKVEATSAKAMTLLEVTASKAEQRIAEAIKPALQTVFHAIGRAEGQDLYVELRQKEVMESFA